MLNFHELRLVGKPISFFFTDYMFSIVNLVSVLKKLESRTDFGIAKKKIFKPGHGKLRKGMEKGVESQRIRKVKET